MVTSPSRTGSETLDPRLNHLHRGKNIELDPTLTGLRHEERDDVPGGPWRTVDSDAAPGVSARWGFTPNLTAAAALNQPVSSDVPTMVTKILKDSVCF